MCTVIYIPGNHSVLFSSNRDEDPNRVSAIYPTVKSANGKKILAPVDGAAGGTWLGVTNAGDLVVLLNGGFDNHTKQNSYRKSRGLIVQQMLESTDMIDCWTTTQLDFIEPFTIIAYVKKRLHQLVWTGVVKVHSYPNPRLPHIWSSSTLYSMDIKRKREQWFNHFTAAYKTIGHRELLHFLRSNPTNDFDNNFIMDRGGKVKTCSMSLIDISPAKAVVDYYDLVTGSAANTELFLENTAAKQIADNPIGSAKAASKTRTTTLDSQPAFQ